MKLSEYIREIEQTLVDIRRHLHMNPEVSMKEFNTQKFIVDILKKHQIEYQITAKTGVIALIKGNSEGKVVAARADIDALPIIEDSNASYKSKNNGIMHACGHDAHTSILLGVAIILSKMKNTFNGLVKLIFQPNEEVSGGAKDIVKEGFLDDVDYVIGLHVMPYLEVGEVEIKYGMLNASSGSFTIDIYGKSSHGAYPETGIDAINISASIINNLHSIFTREMSPLSHNVLSFGKINGGTKSNVIADHVSLVGTLRTVDQYTRKDIKNRINLIVKNTAEMYKGRAEVTFNDGYPAVINDNEVVDVILSVASQFLGNSNIHIKKAPSMGAEDFGYYQDKAKGAFFHLGCGNKKDGIVNPLHSNKFDIDERCLSVGVELQILNILRLLGYDYEY